MPPPNILPLPYRLFLLYLEPLIFSIGGALPVLLDPLSFQAAHSPAGLAPTVLTLANTVTLYQYAAMLLAFGLVTFLSMSTALSLPDPTGASQDRLLRVILLALLIGDIAFASATLVPYYRAGMLDYLDLRKVVGGQVEFLMNPVLNVWLSAVCAGMRVAWFMGVGRETGRKAKSQ